LRQIMTPLSHFQAVQSGEAAYSVLERMLSEGHNILPVIDDNRFLGLVRQDSLLHFAQTRASLGI
jgi:CBS domain-containing protein